MTPAFTTFLYIVLGLATYFIGTLIKGDKWCSPEFWADEAPILRALASIFWPGYVFVCIPLAFVVRWLHSTAMDIRNSR